MNPAGAVATDYDVSWGMGRDNGRDAAELLPLEGVQRFVINNWKSKPPDFLWLRINLINRLWLLLRLLVNWNAKKYEFVKNIESRIFHYLLFALLRHFICQYCRPPDQPSLIFASKHQESRIFWTLTMKIYNFCKLLCCVSLCRHCQEPHNPWHTVRHYWGACFC